MSINSAHLSLIVTSSQLLLPVTSHYSELLHLFWYYFLFLCVFHKKSGQYATIIHKITLKTISIPVINNIANISLSGSETKPAIT